MPLGIPPPTLSLKTIFVHSTILKFFFLDLMNELKHLKEEIQALQRKVDEGNRRQDALHQTVKSLKKINEAKNFNMSKCCHTVCHLVEYITYNLNN